MARAERIVLRWTVRCTAGLPARAAADRRAELESDLWEQIAAARQRRDPERRIARAILRRAALGVPADLAWRAALLRREPIRTPSSSTERTASVSEHPQSGQKVWRHLPEGRLFNQLNDTVDITDQRVEGDSSASDASALMAKGVAANIVSVGFGGAI